MHSKTKRQLIKYLQSLIEQHHKEINSLYDQIYELLDEDEVLNIFNVDHTDDKECECDIGYR